MKDCFKQIDRIISQPTGTFYLALEILLNSNRLHYMVKRYYRIRNF